jgi:hypothetical protein
VRIPGRDLIGQEGDLLHLLVDDAATAELDQLLSTAGHVAG